MNRKHPKVKEEYRFVMRGVNDGKGHIFRFTKPIVVIRAPTVDMHLTRPEYPHPGKCTVRCTENDKTLLVKETEGLWEDDPNYEPSDEEE